MTGCTENKGSRRNASGVRFLGRGSGLPRRPTGSPRASAIDPGSGPSGRGTVGGHGRIEEPALYILTDPRACVGPEWVACHERSRFTRLRATVREMKEGPSGSAIRSLIPSHRELLRSKAEVYGERQSRMAAIA